MAGLHLTGMSLVQFRSHRAARLELDGRPVALYGPNGAGKTNVLEAVSLLSPGRGLRRAGAEELAHRPGGAGWKVRAVVRSDGADAEIETWAEAGQPRQVRIDGKAAPQVALARALRIVWLVPSMDRLWIEGAEGRRRFLDRVTMSFDPGHAEVVLAYEKAMRERNRLLKDMVRDSHWYQALEAQMAEAGEAIRQAREMALTRLARAQAGGATAFPVAELEVVSEDPVPEGAEALAAALAEGRAADLRAGRTLVGPHRVDLRATYAAKGMAAGLCSTGEQKALLISLILANSRALAEDHGAPPIVLLDEVAAHLDAGRRAALYDEIAALGAQAWMTGTGRELFAELGARAQHFEVTETGGASRIEARI
jgi:DNA replication and repair protein RecF